MRAILFVVVALSAATPLRACPHCNIHNYLASSVEDSTEIYVGEVLELPKPGTARVKVVEVLRGSHKPGEETTVQFFGDKDDVGTKHVFSNPKGMPPDFPTLPLELKEEVVFLARKDREISDPQDAVAKVQGVSAVTTNLALKYVKSHFAICREPLFAAYRNLYAQQAKEADIPFLDHRLEMLVAALTSVDDPQALGFLSGCVDALAKEDGGKVDLESRPFRGEPQGNILKAMLTGGPQPAPEYRETVAFRELSKRIQSSVKTAGGTNVRWFAYAVAYDDLPAAEKLLQTLDGERRAAAAIGVFYLSEFYRSWWSIENCDAARTAALALHDGEPLRKWATEQEERLKFFRKKDDR